MNAHSRKKPHFDRLVEMADRTVERCRRSLPPEIRKAEANLPVSYETIPNEDLREEGVEPDLLGLFVGTALDEDPGNDSAPIPAQVLLFLENIWNYADGEDRAFKREVRQTYLHELGHYLSWDEEDLFQRGLD